jgi:uncharacterized protein YjbJ (UPF0337 family)
VRPLFPWGETPRLALAKLTTCGHVTRCGQFSPLVSRPRRSTAWTAMVLRVQVLVGLRNALSTDMNWNQIEGKWKQLTGSVRERWGQFTDDDVQTLTGTKDHLVGKIQERYGIAKEEAEKQAEQWSHALKEA